MKGPHFHLSFHVVPPIDNQISCSSSDIPLQFLIIIDFIIPFSDFRSSPISLSMLLVYFWKIFTHTIQNWENIIITFCFILYTVLIMEVERFFQLFGKAVVFFFKLWNIACIASTIFALEEFNALKITLKQFIKWNIFFNGDGVSLPYTEILLYQ